MRFLAPKSTFLSPIRYSVTAHAFDGKTMNAVYYFKFGSAGVSVKTRVEIDSAQDINHRCKLLLRCKS